MTDTDRETVANFERQRYLKIQERAYLKAQKRRFASGHELDDWLEAEQEIDEESRPFPSY